MSVFKNFLNQYAISQCLILMNPWETLKKQVQDYRRIVETLVKIFSVSLGNSNGVIVPYSELSNFLLVLVHIHLMCSRGFQRNRIKAI